ncbi:MAG: hypothetical protein QXL88_02760 [Candidatus Pacearchaeota archaeon]
MPKEIILSSKSEDFFNFENCIKTMNCITNPVTEKIVVDINAKNKWFLFNFGMLFAYLHYFPNKKIVSAKEIERTPYKSFENVLISIIEKIQPLQNYKINQKKAFIISPVRETQDKITNYLREYKSKLLEKNFEMVHLPIDDTNQRDPIGINICRNNLEVAASSGTIKVFYQKNSLGSVFDLGMIFMLKYYIDLKISPNEKRKIEIINPFDLSNGSYERFLLQLMKE